MPSSPISSRPDAPFEAPWQAQLHALTVALHEAGAFGWDEWSKALGAEGLADDGSDRWERHAAALVGLLERRGLAEAAEVRAMARAWRAAAEATPHGLAIELPD